MRELVLSEPPWLLTNAAAARVAAVSAANHN
jgi:hypothetical protein